MLRQQGMVKQDKQNPYPVLRLPNSPHKNFCGNLPGTVFSQAQVAPSGGDLRPTSPSREPPLSSHPLMLTASRPYHTTRPLPASMEPENDLQCFCLWILVLSKACISTQLCVLPTFTKRVVYPIPKVIRENI